MRLSILYFTVSLVYFSLQPVCKVECDEFFVMNSLYLFYLNSELMVANHLIMSETTKFDTEQNSSKFLLEIMTLLSSANNIGADI